MKHSKRYQLREKGKFKPQQSLIEVNSYVFE